MFLEKIAIFAVDFVLDLDPVTLNNSIRTPIRNIVCNCTGMVLIFTKDTRHVL